MTKHYLINAGSVDDIRSSLKCNAGNYSVKTLESEIIEERKGRNRSTVIKMLEAEKKRVIKNESRLFITQ